LRSTSRTTGTTKPFPIADASALLLLDARSKARTSLSAKPCSSGARDSGIFEAKAQNERFGEIIAALATRAALDEGALVSGELRGALEAAARAAAGARDSGSFESNAQCARFGEIVAAVATRAALDEGALASGELRGALAAAACASAKAFHIAHYASGAKKAADSAALIHATADGKSLGASDV